MTTEIVFLAILEFSVEKRPLSARTSLEPLHMGVSKNRGTPKWMVYNGKPY